MSLISDLEVLNSILDTLPLLKVFTIQMSNDLEEIDYIILHKLKNEEYFKDIGIFGQIIQKQLLK